MRRKRERARGGDGEEYCVLVLSCGWYMDIICGVYVHNI